MAQYQVQDPTGQLRVIEGPEGASDDEVIAQAKRLFATPTPTPTPTPVSQPSGKAIPLPVRIGRGVADIAEGTAQLTSRMIPSAVDERLAPIRRAIGLPGTVAELNQGIANRLTDYEQARAASGETGMDWGRLGGNVLAGIGLPAPAAVTIPGRMAAGAAQGGMLGALQAQKEPAELPRNILAGAAGGGLGAGLFGMASRVVNPVASAALNLLRGEGVRPTLGQALGETASRTEQKAMSIPLLGDVITSARQSAVGDFNRAAFNRALQPIGEKLPTNVTIGYDAVEYTGRQLGAAYDNLLPKLRISADQTFQADLAGVRNLAQSMPDAQMNQLGRIITNEVEKRFTPAGLMSGETMKAVESKLGGLAKEYQKSADYDIRNLGDAIQEVQASLRRMVERNNPNYQGELQKINAGWANFIRAQTAAGRQGSRGGIFSPEAYLGAVRSSDQSRNRAAFARGGALSQDLATAAVQTLGRNYPESGTAGRLMLGGGMLGGIGAIDPTTAALTASTAIPYLPGMRQATNALMMPRPALAPLSNLLLQASSVSAPLAAPLAQQYLQP